MRWLEPSPTNFLNRILTLALAHLQRRGVRLLSHRIYHWASAEGSGWKRWILELNLDADSDDALRIWDELGDIMQAELDTVPKWRRGRLWDRISLVVNWREA